MFLKDNIITLREYRKEDWERVHLYASIPDFTQYEAWGPNTEADTKNFIELMLTKQNQHPRFEFEFAIEHNETGLLIGGCGIRKESSNSSIANIGYAVNPDFQKMGIATTATKLLIQFGFEELNLDIIYATCDSKNIASYTVMAKCEMNRVGHFKNKRKFKDAIRDEYRYEISNKQSK